MDEQKETSVGGGLSAKQKHAIPYLVQNPNISEAAEQAGISRATVYEWLKVPAFREELERQRLISYDETLAEFHSLGGAALDSYREAFGYYQTKWPAARDFFRQLARTKELSVNAQRASETARRDDAILKRLEDIEKKLAAIKATDPPEPSVVKLKRRSGSKKKN